jgi:hypothetical protein
MLGANSKFFLLSNMWQLESWPMCILFAMVNQTRILSVQQDDGDGIIVTFSDGTKGGYVTEELLELRPVREFVHKPGEHNLRQTPSTQI